MSLALPGIGILFDIDALGGGYYGYKAWQIFMRHIRSDELSACILVEGDALMNLAGSDNLFCIGIYGMADFREIRERFEMIDETGLALMPGRIIDKPVLDLLPLPIRANVDAFGRLETESWNRIDHDLCKEAGWGYNPKQVPADLDEVFRKELHHMKVEVPMEQMRRSPEPNTRRPAMPNRMAAGPPKDTENKESGRWAALRRLFSRRSS